MLTFFRLYGGPMDGQVVALPIGSTQLKVVVPDEPLAPEFWERTPEAEIKTHAEFYVSTGFAGRLDYQPNPFHKIPGTGRGNTGGEQ